MQKGSSILTKVMADTNKILAQTKHLFTFELYFKRVLNIYILTGKKEVDYLQTQSSHRQNILPSGVDTIFSSLAILDQPPPLQLGSNNNLL